MSATRCFLPDQKKLFLGEVIGFRNHENTGNYSTRAISQKWKFWNLKIYLLKYKFWNIPLKLGSITTESLIQIIYRAENFHRPAINLKRHRASQSGLSLDFVNSPAPIHSSAICFSLWTPKPLTSSQITGKYAFEIIKLKS